MSGKKRQSEYRKRMAAKGFVQKSIWVPAHAAPALDAIAGLRFINDPPGTSRAFDNVSLCEGIAGEMWTHYKESVQLIGGDDMTAEAVDAMTQTVMAVLVAIMPRGKVPLPYEVDPDA